MLCVLFLCPIFGLFLIMEYGIVYENGVPELVACCRLCGNSSETLIPIFKNQGLELKLPKKIKEHLPFIDLSLPVDLLIRICYSCASTIVSWHELYYTCKRVNENVVKYDCKVEINETVKEEYLAEQLPIDDNELNHFRNSTESLNSRSLKNLSSNVELLEVQADLFFANSQVDEINTYQNSLRKSLEPSRELVSRKATNNSTVPVGIGFRIVEPSQNISDPEPKYYQKENLKCSFCSRTFSNKVTLIIHENEERIVRCNLKIFRYLNNQTPIQDTNGCFECNYCQLKFQTKNAIRAHIHWNHICEKLLKCDSCLAEFQKECDLAAHRSVHSIDAKLVCRVCGGRTKTSDRFPYEKKYTSVLVQCSCAPKIKSGENLIQSKPTEPTTCYLKEELKPLSIDNQSNLNLEADASSLSSHVLSHHSVTFIKTNVREKNLTWWDEGSLDSMSVLPETPNEIVCKFCNQKFSSIWKLNYHRRRFHNPKAVCKICSKEYISYYLKKHMEIHAEEKKYVCDKCGKRFAQLSSLKSHKMIEDKIKKKMCNICGKRFAVSSALQYHLKEHLTVKPFQCPDCDRAYGYIWQLRKHQRCHSDQRDFKCDVCQKAFKTNKNLAQHLKSDLHHRTECGVSLVNQKINFDE